MIVSRTPLRMSFVGGGTDLPSFFEAQGGGAVVSTAIDKSVRAIVSPRFEGDVRVGYTKTEIVARAGDVEHDLVREAMRRTGLTQGLDVLTLADVPGGGTGLGSSSAVTVSLLNALYAYRNIYRSSHALAREACEIEIDALGKPIGYQDQYACAVGGFNLLEFRPGGKVHVSPVIAASDTFSSFQRSLMLFFTGRSRASDTVLTEQKRGNEAGSNIEALKEMRALAYRFRDLLGEGDVEGTGRLLHENWLLKQTVAAGVTSADLDLLYARAIEAGAWGGKVLGAGGGGFLLVSAPDGSQAQVRRELAELREVPFRFCSSGTQIILLEER